MMWYLIGAVAYLAVLVFVLALCKTAARADRRAEAMYRHPSNGGNR